MLGLQPRSPSEVERARPALKGTMLGVAPPHLVPAQPAPPHAAPNAPPSAAPTQGSAASPAGLKRTMLGMAAPEPALPPPAPAQNAEYQAATVPAAHGDPKPSLKRTMLGVAPATRQQPSDGAEPQALAFDGNQTLRVRDAPMPAGTQPGQGPAASYPGTLPGERAAAALPDQPPKSPGPGEPRAAPLGHRTILGVAVPGIAPINPGQAKSPPVSAPPSPPPIDPRLLSAPAPPARARPKGHKGALVLIVVAAFLLAGGALFAWLWDAPRPIAAEVQLDDQGREQLALRCDNCPNDTKVTLQGASAHFTGGRATLPLHEPLTVGANDFTVTVERPGMGRDETVSLSVPIEYRVAGDFAGLSEDPPVLRVLVEARPGTTALVNGSAVNLDAAGKGTYSIDVSKELVGTADEVLPLERKIPYAVTPPSGAVNQGEVTLRVGIVPLRIDAPGPRIVIEEQHFKLTGQTLKDGTVTVAGRPITVDSEGRFSQLMNVSSVGQTKIMVAASAKDHAPRMAPIVVKRVDDLEKEARSFESNALKDYQSLAENVEAHVGDDVALRGKVIEARWDRAMVALLDVESGCPESPCLARVIYGQRLDLQPDARLRVYGAVSRQVEGPRTGDTIPEIRADFVLRDGAR